VFDKDDNFAEQLSEGTLVRSEEVQFKSQKLYLNKEELTVLYDWIQWQYISYDNVPLMDLVKKIRNIVNP
jgi:hypothetical protein